MAEEKEYVIKIPTRSVLERIKKTAKKTTDNDNKLLVVFLFIPRFLMRMTRKMTRDSLKNVEFITLRT